jgi:hypothetical protein
MWFNYAGLPIIIYKKRAFDRSAARERIKRAFAINSKIERNYQFLEQRLVNKARPHKYSSRSLLEEISAVCVLKSESIPTEKNNFQLNQVLELNKKIILSEKKNLQEDEKNYSRKNIKYKLLAYIGEQQVELSGYIKIRIQNKTGELDIFNLKNNIAASSTHADDASIIIKASWRLSRLNIPHSVIHDSIGAPLEFSPIIKFFFKNECAEYQDYALKEYTFPFNLLNAKFSDSEMELSREKFMKVYKNNRAATQKNLQKLKQEIIMSRNLFN